MLTILYGMALNGPYTVDDLLRMTGCKPKPKPAWLETLAARCAEAAPGGGAATRKSAIRHPQSAIRRAPRSLRLLGIDPGTRRVGWGVVEYSKADARLKLLACGCITPSGKLPLKDRLRDIFSELETVLQRTQPHAAALEETFAGVNMKSAIAMGEGRGIALLCLARAGIDVLELSPRSIKQAVTGSGAAGKARVAAMVAAQLGLKTPPTPEDITDALAAAIALARRT